MKTTSLGPILFSLLTLSSIEQPVNGGQSNIQNPHSPSSTALEQTVALSGGRILITTLPKTVDIRKLKTGDTLTAIGTDFGVLMSSSVTLVGRVLETHVLSSSNKDSLLRIRFEKIKFGNNQEVPVHLKLLAVVAPLAFKWSISPIIVDHYPCDYEADPKGCEESAKNQVHMSQSGYGGKRGLVCEKNPIKGQGQPAFIPVGER